MTRAKPGPGLRRTSPTREDVFGARRLGGDDWFYIGQRVGVRVRRSAINVENYGLAVATDDVADVVTAAGGWLYDRVRAGWRVTVFVPASCDSRPLEILGVRTAVLDADRYLWVGTAPTALAVASGVLRSSEALTECLRGAVDSGKTEISVWGEGAQHLGRHLDRVQHRLSGAAIAFKRHAVAACGLPSSACDMTEMLASCSMWYPPEGADLEPVDRLELSL